MGAAGVLRRLGAGFEERGGARSALGASGLLNVAAAILAGGLRTAGKARPIREREVPWENRVSKVLGAMSVLWIAVPDGPGPDSSVATSNATASLCQQPQPRPDRPAVARLARSPRTRTQIRSGLWNVNHVTEHHDPRMLGELATAVAATVKPAT